jgi:hypothetical protein
MAAPPIPPKVGGWESKPPSSGSQKCGNYTLYVWRTVWCPPNELRRRDEQQLADFSPNKGAPANRKKGFYKIRLLNNDEVRGIIV